jgi:hypothetical protein
MPLTSKGKKIMASMKKRYGKNKGEEVFYASKNKGTIEGVEETKENKPMNHLEKFINQILLGEQTDPTDAEIKAANKDVHTMDKGKPKHHPKSPAAKLAKAAEERTRVKKAKYFGGESDPKKVDTKAAIAKHRAEIYAAGKKAGPVAEPQNDSFDPALVYKQMGNIISEVLTPKQHAKETDGGEEASERRRGRIKAVMSGKKIGDVSAMRAMGKKGTSLSQGAEIQKKYRERARAKRKGDAPLATATTLRGPGTGTRSDR